MEMEGFEKAIRPSEAAGASSDLMLTSRSRRTVSLLTCSKLCGVCFVAGLVVGFTLKRRLRKWAATLLRRIKDD